MTAQPLGFDFALMSPLSARPPHAVAREEMQAEVEQELSDRAAFYGRMVERQKMRAEDAARHIEIMEAIAADLAGGGVGPMYGQGFSWDAKVRELRRELALRRNAWPRRIAKPGDPLDEATARRRMERLDAVHFLYWIELFQFGFAVGEHDAAGALDRVRAQVWRVESWEQAALAEGRPEVRPRMVAYYEAIASGDPVSVRIWTTLEAAAAKHGFLEVEQAA